VEGRDSLESMAKGVTDGSSLEGLLDGVGSDESDDTDEDEAESEEQAGIRGRRANGRNGHTGRRH